MIDLNPSHRPTLDQIKDCDLCLSSSHTSAIQTLIDGQRVWIRRLSRNDSLMTEPPSLPSISLMKSFPHPHQHTHQHPHQSFSTSSSQHSNQSYNSNEIHDLLSSSRSPTVSEECFLTGSSCAGTSRSLLISDHMDMPNESSHTLPSLSMDLLFESPASRSITNWTQTQHLKYEESLQILHSINSSLPSLVENTSLTTNRVSSNLNSNQFSSIPSVENRILKKISSFPSRCCSSLTSSKKTPLHRNLSSLA